MIQVCVDLSHASREEVESLFNLPGFSRTVDELAASGRKLGITLDLRQPVFSLAEVAALQVAS